MNLYLYNNNKLHREFDINDMKVSSFMQELEQEFDRGSSSFSYIYIPGYHIGITISEHDGDLRCGHYTMHAEATLNMDKRDGKYSEPDDILAIADMMNEMFLSPHSEIPWMDGFRFRHSKAIKSGSCGNTSSNGICRPFDFCHTPNGKGVEMYRYEQSLKEHPEKVDQLIDKINEKYYSNEVMSVK